jgi:hypothetical protein
MFQDYEQNDNYRYIPKDDIYPYQKEGNILNNSNNKDQNKYYNNNNYNNYQQNNNINNSFNYSNESYPKTPMTEKKDETINSSILNSKTIDVLSNRYFSKVEVDNIRQTTDIIYMLDNYLTENNYPKNYQINSENNKITFLFFEEDVAFKFTKFLNSIKSRNALYMEMNVHLSLTPNNNYNKKKDAKEIKKRGLSVDSIQRLFNGIGSNNSKKREKNNNINPNLDLGVSSPFMSPYEKRRNKKAKNKNNSHINEKLKDYNRLPIRVLDDYYKPLRSPDFRPIEKKKWISPINFNINFKC